LGVGSWEEDTDLFLGAALMAVFFWTMNLKDCETHTIRAIRIGSVYVGFCRIGSVYVGFCSTGPVIYPGFYVAKRLYEEERATVLLQHLSQQGYV